MNDKQHRVAWADRIGLNKQWAKDIISCSESYGTPYYITAVERFKNNIVNIKDGPQLKTLIEEYIKGPLMKWKAVTFNAWVEKEPIESQYDSWIRDTQKIIDNKSYELLYNYILQLLENNNFVFYESTVEFDDASLNIDNIDNEE